MKRPAARNIVAILLVVLVLMLGIYQAAAAAGQVPGVKTAWERVQEAGSYRFHSAINQTLIPRALPEMVGKQEEYLSLSLKGAAILPDQAYIEMVSNDVTTQSPVVLILDGSQYFVLLDGEFSPVENPIGAALPTADWLGYLAAAENVQVIQPEPGGEEGLTRLSFNIDGPRLAEYVRQQQEAALQQEPGSPREFGVSASPLLKRLSGNGELWVGADGLPIRQVLNLDLPEVSSNYDAQLHIEVDLSDYGRVESLPRVVPGEDGGWMLQTIAPKPPAVAGGLPILFQEGSAVFVDPSNHALFGFCMIIAALLVLYLRRPRWAYAVIALSVSVILMVSPLLESAQAAGFFTRQAQAAQDREASTHKLIEALGYELNTDQPAAALAPEAIPQASPGTGSEMAAASSLALNTPASTSELATSDTGMIESCGQGDPTLDFDQDGLSDLDEGCFGTDPYDADTDGDSITDTLEIQGFDWNGTHYTSDPFEMDSNRDSLPDGVEWPAPVGEAPAWDPDGDGKPNIWDSDNDDDGVPDSSDLSPYAVGNYSSDDNPISIEVWDRDRQGYQYIEFQLQPEDLDHLRYTNTWLDWPDSDNAGTVTSQITSTQDLRLTPFLDVATTVLPEEKLCTQYGVVVTQATGQAPHLLIPLFPQEDGGAVNSFLGKVAYGPNTAPQVRWTEARLVWLVQSVDKDKKSGVIHTYREPFRLTGMQVTNSDGYELGLFATPNSALEDTQLFKFVFGMSAIFLEYRSLENQSEPTALQEVAARFADPTTTPAYTWGVTETVRSSVEMYTHQEQALAESGAQVERFLNEYFRRSDQLCIGADGMTFECGGIVIGTEERMRAIPVESLEGSTIRVDMTGVEMFTMRGLRYQLYQRTGLEWEAATLARILEIMEKRYAGRWEASLEEYQIDFPYLTEQDLHFAAYLAYQSWLAGRISPISIGDISIASPELPYEGGVIQVLGSALTHAQFVFDTTLMFGELDNELNSLNQEIKSRAKVGVLTQEKYEDLTQKIADKSRSNTRYKILGCTVIAISLAAFAVNAAYAICADSDDCTEENLKGWAVGISFLDLAAQGAETTYVAIKNGTAVKSLSAGWSSMTTAAKVFTSILLIIQVGLILYQFFATKGDQWFSGFQFSAVFGTAIVALIFAVISFALMLIPGVNIVFGIVLLVIGVIDLALWALDVDFSVMNTIMSIFYRAEMTTELESYGYSGGYTSLKYQDKGLVPGNALEMTDTFVATINITGTWWNDLLDETGALNESNARAEWNGGQVDGVIVTPMNSSPSLTTHQDSTHKDVQNNVGIGFEFTRPQRDLPLQIILTIYETMYFEQCITLICWYQPDSRTISPNPDDPIILDILPDSIDSLWQWSAITNPDPDGDGLVNASDPFPDAWDKDGDSLGDRFELDYAYGSGTDPAVGDSDADGLDDGREITFGTDPNDSDSDDDGLLDGLEVAGWDVHLPSGATYRVYADPLKDNADSDGLTDKSERDSHTSPYAFNVTPQFLVTGQPLSAAPDGRLGIYVAPGTTIPFTLALSTIGSEPVTTTLQVSLTGAQLGNLQVLTAGLSSGTAPLTDQCGENCYQWDFGSTPIPVNEVFTVTLTADAVAPSGTSALSFALPYQEMILSGDLKVVVDDDNPTATLTAPADGDILTGEYYVIGGYALDSTTWAEEVDLLIAPSPVAVDLSLGSWAYSWPLPSDGVYTLGARARDPFGHEGGVTLVNVTVDNTPPETSITLAEGAVIHPQDDRVTVAGMASDNLVGLVRVQVSVDGGTWEETVLDPAPRLYPPDAAWSYAWEISAEAQGSHTLAARALDRGGNMSSEAQVGFIIDSMPPRDDLLIRLDDQAPIVKADPSVTLEGYANDAGNLPLPPRPTALNGELDAVADATVWLSPESIEEDDAGVTLAWAGDMDGDRQADLALGFPASKGGAGKVVVLYGHYGDWRLPPDAESLAEEMTSFVGAPGAGLGAHLAAVGDVNGDGLDDLLVGDPVNKRAFLVYSKPSPMGREQKLDGNEPRPVRYTRFTRRDDGPLADFVAPAGDINGDGYADLWIGATDKAYLILGRNGMLEQTNIVVDCERTGYCATAATSTLPAGGRTTGVGDVNGDQLDDWVVTNPGKTSLYLLSGSSALTAGSRRRIDPGTTDPLKLATLDSDGFETIQVAALGDVNSDGLADFMYSSGDAPRLVLGRTGGPWGTSYEFKDYTPAPEGFLVAPGDVNSDGMNDLLLGTSDQRAYLILGRRTWNVGEVYKEEAMLMGVAGAASSPLAAGADANCDRSADLLLLPSGSVEVTSPAPIANGKTIYIDDDYCDDCANDKHGWGTDAFNSIQVGLEAAKARRGPVTVSVKPGIYAESLTLTSSHVRLVGIDADEVVVDGGNAGDVITVADVVDVEIRGLHIIHSGEQPNTGIRVNKSRDVRITRNLIQGNDQGILFEGASSGEVAFNTIVDNRDAGLHAAGAGTRVNAFNNILAGNEAGLVSGTNSNLISLYNLLYNTTNYQNVLTGDGDIQADPLFVTGASNPYHLQEGSPALDSAGPWETAQAGGGSRADIGYDELRAVPLMLFFGKQGTSCVEGNSGVSQLEVALIPVPDTRLPITATLPAGGQWHLADLQTPGQVASYWSLAIEPQQDGLHRVYTRATDVLDNQEENPDDWYSGAMLVDGTPPTVSWIKPVETLTVTDIALHLQASASDWLATGSGTQFNVAQVHFEVNGKIYPASWVVDGWNPESGQPRPFEALAPLQEESNEIIAVATDLAGHETRSNTIKATSIITGSAAAITSILDGSATKQSKLVVSGYARFANCVRGEHLIQVQVDNRTPQRAKLEYPGASFSAWSALVDLGREGKHTLTVAATCNANVAPNPITTLNQIHIWYDRTAPVLVISPVPGGAQVEEVTFEGNVNDTGSGTASVEVSLDGVNWTPASLNDSKWSFIWTTTIKEPGITYWAKARAIDRAGNATIQTRSFTVDSEPPGGIQPIKFNFPVGAHLEGLTNELEASWEPPIDSSGQVTVLVSIDQVADTLPEQVVNGTSYSGPLNASGLWYFHLLARDAAGNGFLYHEGPWQVSSFESGQSIVIDGYLDLANSEWNEATELLDDDERALAGIVPVQFKAERQSLYATWDNEALYLGWRGAWWDLHGTMWAFVDAKSGGSKAPPPAAGLLALPFDTDYAIQISGADGGTLWEYSSLRWQSAAEGLNFSQGSSGDTEVRLALDLSTRSNISLAALALDDEREAWSTFPTTNSLGQLVDAYHWEGYLGDITPNAGQPVGTTVVLRVNPKAPQKGLWGPGSVIPYSIEVKNWEQREVADLQLSFSGGEGLLSIPAVILPVSAPISSYAVDVSDQLMDNIGSLTEVMNTIFLQLGGIELDQATLRYPVDGLAPVVEINVPPYNVISTGLQLVSGSAADGAGAGVANIEVCNNNACQLSNGTMPWTAKVNIPPDATTYTLEVRAKDEVENVSTATHTFVVDTTPPELSYTLPSLLTGDDFVLFGSARDGKSQVMAVEVQLDGVELWLPVRLPLQPDDAGEQPWLFSWDLPPDDYVEHQLRARAIDVGGNETMSDWKTTVIDTVAPAITVTTTLDEILLVDYYAGNPNRDLQPIAKGTVSDGGGLSSLVARIVMPDEVEVIAPAVMEGTTFSITPTFKYPVAGEYRYHIEATDNAGNRTINGPFSFIVKSILTPSILSSDQGVARVEIINKTNQAVSIILSDENMNYVLKVEAGAMTMFTIARANYNRITYACGASDTGFLNVTKQVRLVFTPCGYPSPNMGEPSIEKIQIPNAPKGKRWFYK